MIDLKSVIKRRLKGYKIPLNQPNLSLPTKIQHPKKVAVVGGGIAGLVAAMELSEKGFEVEVWEKNAYWGGKLGSWTFKSANEELRTTHGFHAFFNQYYNFLNWMDKYELSSALEPIEDYKVMFNEHESMGFNDIENTPGLNILALRKKGVFPWYTFINPFSIPFLNLLKYDPVKTFKKYDSVSYAQFARKTMMPKKMRIVFNSFARAFFAEPDKMSMAELIKSFHFYFLSNDKGLVYKTLNDDFEYTFLQPVIERLKRNKVRLKLNSELTELKKSNEGFELNNEKFDFVFLATDIMGTKAIVEKSNGLSAQDFSKISAMKQGAYYAVYRVWTDSFEQKPWPYFVITDKKRSLDSITFYHKTEKESAAWSAKNKGGIFELHCYSLPENLSDEAEIKKALLDEFYAYLPELRNMKIKHEYFQLRNDFPAFYVGEYKGRQEIEAQTKGLYFIGDWVKMDNPAMLMEAACTSAIIAANKLCTLENIQETQLFTVPKKGLFA